MIQGAAERCFEESLSTMDGVIVVDKPAGITSFDVIREVRKALGIRKIGHTGTLDPIATGVLPLCLNEATKVAGFLTEEDKEYLATMLLGVKTDTQDITGRVIEERDPESLTVEDLQSVIEGFQGRIVQGVPPYSAAKYRGRPRHRWVREGVPIDTPKKEVIIYNIRMESISHPYVTFRVSCSKGTYIRVLCDDMGDRLGCGATLADLRRTRSGAFGEEDALPLTYLSRREGRAFVKERIIPLLEVLGNLKTISVPPDVARKIREGYQPEWGHFKDNDLPLFEREELVRLVAGDKDMVAVARALLRTDELSSATEREQVFRLVRVFKG